MPTYPDSEYVFKLTHNIILFSLTRPNARCFAKTTTHGHKHNTTLQLATV